MAYLRIRERNEYYIIWVGEKAVRKGGGKGSLTSKLAIRRLLLSWPSHGFPGMPYGWSSNATMCTQLHSTPQIRHHFSGGECSSQPVHSFPCPWAPIKPLSHSLPPLDSVSSSTGLRKEVLYVSDDLRYYPCWCNTREKVICSQSFQEDGGHC